MFNVGLLFLSGFRGFREIGYLYSFKMKSFKCFKRGIKCFFICKKSNYFWLREMKEVFMILVFKLVLEEWEEFKYMEMSKKVIEGIVRVRCGGEKSFVKE